MNLFKLSSNLSGICRIRSAEDSSKSASRDYSRSFASISSEIPPGSGVAPGIQPAQALRGLFPTRIAIGVLPGLVQKFIRSSRSYLRRSFRSCSGGFSGSFFGDSSFEVPVEISTDVPPKIRRILGGVYIEMFLCVFSGFVPPNVPHRFKPL